MYHVAVLYWPLPSNQSFYSQIAGYQRGMGDRRVVMGQLNRYRCKTLIGVHSTMHLMHPSSVLQLLLGML